MKVLRKVRRVGRFLGAVFGFGTLLLPLFIETGGPDGQLTLDLFKFAASLSTCLLPRDRDIGVSVCRMSRPSSALQLHIVKKRARPRADMGQKS